MKRINIDRKILYVIFIILLFLIVSLTVIYAALSVVLNITGIGVLNASNWNILLSNSSNNKYANSCTGSATYTNPVITGTTIAGYSVSLAKPGDSVILFFDINNNGTLNGEITSIINGTPLCVSSTGNMVDAQLVCDNLNVSFSYMNGEEILVGDVMNPADNICSASGDFYSSSYLKLVISLKSSMSSVPSSSVTISNLSHDLVFSQTDKKCNNS